MKVNLSNGESFDGILTVRRDFTSSAPARANWRLAWDNPNGTGFVYCEGECSVRYYMTMRQAVGAGVLRFGAVAVRGED
jgi:hypothetical protein